MLCKLDPGSMVTRTTVWSNHIVVRTRSSSRVSGYGIRSWPSAATIEPRSHCLASVREQSA